MTAVDASCEAAARPIGGSNGVARRMDREACSGDERRREKRFADALRAPGRHHRGDGVRREARKARRRSWCAAKWRAAAPSFPPTSIIAIARADGHRRRLQVQDQREHRQFRDHLEHRRRTRKAASRRALRLRHGDGPFHRRRHSHDSQGDHRRLARADRHGADLRSALAREAHRGFDHRADARSDRGAGRAGRGLHDDPRRRAARIPAAGAQPHHRNRQPRRRAAGAVDELRTRRKISCTSTSTRSARFSRSTTSAFRWATACVPAAWPTPATQRNSPN